MLQLAIIYRTPEGRPLSLATIVSDGGLLQHAAAAAMLEAQSKADELYAVDPVLARIQMEAAQKLRRILSVLLPPAPEIPVA